MLGSHVAIVFRMFNCLYIECDLKVIEQEIEQKTNICIN